MPLTDVGFYDAKTLQKLLGVGGQVLQYKGAYDTASPDATAGISAAANTARSSAIGLGLDPGVVNEYFGPGVTKAQAQKNMTYLSGLASAAQSRIKVTPSATPSITPGSVVGTTIVPAGAGVGTTEGVYGNAGIGGPGAMKGGGGLTPTEIFPVTPKPDPLMQTLLDMMKRNTQGTSGLGDFTVPPVDLGALRTEAQGQVKIETDPQLLALRQQQENLNRIFDQKIRDLEPKFNLYTTAVTAAAARQRVGAKERLNTRGLYFTSLLDDVIGDIDESELASIGAAAADKTSLIKNMAEDLAGASQHLGQQKAQIESLTGLKENLIFATLKREAEAAARQGALDQFNARARAAELNSQSVGQNMSALMTLITNQQGAYQKELDREFTATQSQLDRDLETWKFREQLDVTAQESLWKRIEASQSRIADITASSTAFGRQKELAGISLAGQKELTTIKADESPLDFYLRIQTARDGLLRTIADPATDPTVKGQIQAQIKEYEDALNTMRPKVMGPGGFNLPGPGGVNLPGSVSGTTTTTPAAQGVGPEAIIAMARAAGMSDAEIARGLRQKGYNPAQYGFPEE
jgi:hypothetical protein